MNLPNHFGQYRLIRVIGEGTTCIVAEALHCQTGKSYAMKIIDSCYSLPPYIAKAIQREIRVLERLDHPNIIRLIEVIEQNGIIFIVLAFLAKNQ
jgi:serine/threonine protein kinase